MTDTAQQIFDLVCWFVGGGTGLGTFAALVKR